MSDLGYDDENPEEELNDGWGHSDFNDGQGIKVTVTFTPLPAPLAAGQKRRANSKPESISKIAYFHEQLPMKEFLSKATTIVQRQDLLQNSWLYRDEELATPNSITVAYMIPRSVTTRVEITVEDDFTTMIAEAMKKPKAEIKLFILEHKVHVEDELDVGSENDEAAQPAVGPGQSKKRKKELPPQEVTQAKIIQDIERRHRCEDRSCGKTPCYVQGPNAHHIHLTYQHLRLWAAAIEAKQDHVNVDTPPNAKLFDPQSGIRHADTDDIALLAKRRLSNARGGDNSSHGITVLALGDLLAHRSDATLTPGQASPLTAMSAVQNELPPPPMALSLFCSRYKLLDALEKKLDDIQITGPHVLRLVGDTDLRSEGKLSVGELASVRDAQMRWMYDTRSM